MNSFRLALCSCTFAIAGVTFLATSMAADPVGGATSNNLNLKGPHGFDFEIGNWKVHHRLKRKDQWVEMDGTCTDRSAMDESANVEEHTFNRAEGVTRGMAIRAYDAKTGLWAIWWIDSRDPHGALDPPVKGKFENGVGTFYSDSVVDGKPSGLASSGRKSQQAPPAGNKRLPPIPVRHGIRIGLWSSNGRSSFR